MWFFIYSFQFPTYNKLSIIGSNTMSTRWKLPEIINNLYA